MSKNIEIEIRGPLTKKKLDDLIVFFEKEGEKITEKNRVLIDYSTFLEGGIEDRKKDIRLRVTNGIPEIIVKLGGWGEAEHRKELSVLTGRGDFDTLVEIFAALGFTKGMLCERKTMVYQYVGIEFALVEVPGHSYYYEAEKMADEKEDSAIITEEIIAMCKKLGLEVFDKKSFFDYIDTLNKEANEVFDFQKYTPNYFKDRFGL
jgi:predicted adenylyl cyclase CyaB